MMEKQLWLRFKELLHDVSEGKKSVNEALTITLKALEKIEEKEDLETIAKEQHVVTISEDGIHI